MHPPASPWKGCLLAFALCGCGSEAPPPASKGPAPSSAPAPSEPTEPTEPTEPIEEIIPDVPPVRLPAVDERCLIRVAGGPRLARAAVKMESGRIRPGDVEGGYTVGYDCPEEIDRTGVDLIAQLENARHVHWTDVDVGADRTADVVASTTRAGLPKLTPEEKELLEEQGFEIPDEPVTNTVTGPPRVKVPVVFMPHKLPWAELQLTARGQHPQHVTLAGRRMHPLLPGQYEVLVRQDPEGDWESAGTLTIDEGKSHTVKLFRRPLALTVTSVALDPAAPK